MDFTRMGKKPDKPAKEKKMTAKEQSARFIKTARELEVDETGKLFELTAQKVLRSKPRP